ncbi:MAG: hypothetical protein IPI93_03160 [Sphingobacteriaceae bacterium]|nr:hypothetical protein [Sphingobacteriaceae bacterium]MBK7819347.1 hypothetical protein [Sphingobacteriaceae bacterium]
MDDFERRQGYWIIYGKDKQNTTCYKPEQKIEEGSYVNNKKNGVWKEYFCNGNFKNTLTFANGRPDGYAKMFYENGNLKEEGTWKINKWVGVYTLYKENGEIENEFLFDSKGRTQGDTTKRESIIGCGPPWIAAINLCGPHTLYNKNKQKTKEGEFKDNRFINGKAYIYDENGILTRIAVYKDGVYVGDAEISK